MSSISEVIRTRAETILSDVDYDIYKEDLEERTILDDIEFRLKDMLQDICNGYTLDEILDFINS